MAGTKAVRTSQPAQPVPISRGNRLTDSLQALQLATAKANLVNGAPGTVSSSIVPLRAGRYGWHQYYKRGTGNQKTTHTVPGVTGGITFMVVGALYSVTAGGQVIGALRTSSGGTARLSIGEASNSKHTLTVTPSGGSAVTVVEASGTTEDAIWIGRVDAAGGVSFFRNGVLIGTATAASANFSDVTVMEVGSTNFLNDPNCRVYLQAFWTRALADSEIGALSVNPWQLFAANRSPQMGPADVGGGGVSYGMGAETDTAFTLSGSMSGNVGLASETDAAFALGGRMAGAPGVAAETDTALALTGAMAGSYGLATETDSALALTSGTVFGLASETDTALALGGRMAGTYGVAEELDTALAPGTAPEAEATPGGYYDDAPRHKRKKLTVLHKDDRDEKAAEFAALLAKVKGQAVEKAQAIAPTVSEPEAVKPPRMPEIKGVESATLRAWMPELLANYRQTFIAELQAIQSAQRAAAELQAQAAIQAARRRAQDEEEIALLAMLL